MSSSSSSSAVSYSSGSTLVSVYAYSYSYESDDDASASASASTPTPTSTPHHHARSTTTTTTTSKTSRTSGRVPIWARSSKPGHKSSSKRKKGGGKGLLDEKTMQMSKLDTAAKRHSTAHRARKAKSKADAVAANNRVSRVHMNKSAKSVNVCVERCKYDVVRAAIDGKGWRVQKSNATHEWDVYWIDSTAPLQILATMKPFQRINHFPGMHEICRKDSLARNLTRLQKLFPGAFEYFPKTWVLPADYGDFTAHFRKRTPAPLICKPENSAQGRGIFLTQTGSEIGPFDHYVAQVYLGNPMLIDGFKFDLRIYVLVVSADPLRIFIYDDGLVRLCTEPYTKPTSRDLGSAYQHLTNYSVNKKNTNFEAGDGSSGAKRSISSQNAIWASQGLDVPALWASIDDAIVKTLIAAQPTLAHMYSSVFSKSAIDANPFQCFEVLGFDIMLDEDAKPWILEVNHSPSFGTDAQIDKDVKLGLISETLDILGLDAKAKSRHYKAHRAAVQERLAAAAQDHPGTAPSAANTNDDVPLTTKRTSSTAATTTTTPAAATPTTQSPFAYANTEYWAPIEARETEVLKKYRRIYPTPSPAKMDEYSKYFVNTSTLYSETATSAARRERALAQRQAAEEERLKREAIKARFSGRAKAAQDMLAAKLEKGSMSVRKARPKRVSTTTPPSGEEDGTGLPPPERDCEGRVVTFDLELFALVDKFPGIPIEKGAERKRIQDKRRRDAMVHVSRVRDEFEASIMGSMDMAMSWNLPPAKRTALHASIRAAHQAELSASPDLAATLSQDLDSERSDCSQAAAALAAQAAAQAAAIKENVALQGLGNQIDALLTRVDTRDASVRNPPVPVASRFNENSYLVASKPVSKPVSKTVSRRSKHAAPPPPVTTTNSTPDLGFGISGQGLFVSGTPAPARSSGGRPLRR